jgi:Zn-dependent metalloprotease
VCYQDIPNEIGDDEFGKPRSFSCSKKHSTSEKLLRCSRYQVFTYKHPGDVRFPYPANGYLVSSSPSDCWSRTGVSAHANTLQVAMFLEEILEHGSGLTTMESNESGQTIGYSSFVNFPEDNAYWHPGRNAFYYGQRGQGVPSYASSISIVAHEIFHGITHFICELASQYESGALNESYSDVFAVLLANRDKPNIGEWDWIIGIPATSGDLSFPLRDLSAPEMFGQPDHMRDYAHVAEDQGGVHRNNGIHNKAAYHLLTSRNSNGDYLFDLDSAGSLFYYALYELRPDSTFIDSRIALTFAASRGFDQTQGQEVIVAINNAFDIVGIQ